MNQYCKLDILGDPILGIIKTWNAIIRCSQVNLKALFNNVSTYKTLRCMALHTISVCDGVYK